MNVATLSSLSLEQWLAEFDRLKKLNAEILKPAKAPAGKRKRSKERRRPIITDSDSSSRILAGSASAVSLKNAIAAMSTAGSARVSKINACSTVLSSAWG